MQTETTFQSEPTAAIDRKIAAAQATLEKLQAAASKAADESERARITFEKEPTSQSHGEHQVAIQRAKNAHAAVESFTTGELAGLQAERQRIVDDADRERLRPLLDRERISREQRRMVAAIVHAQKEISEATREIVQAMQDRQRYQARGASLGLQAPGFPFEVALQGVLAEVHRQIPDAQNGRQFTKLAFGAVPGSSVETFVYLEGHIPAVVPVPFRQ